MIVEAAELEKVLFYIRISAACSLIWILTSRPKEYGLWTLKQKQKEESRKSMITFFWETAEGRRITNIY